MFQSVRGTFGSGGEFTPMVNEVADGADTVAWLRDQPWFTGTFATIGLSYLGFTQWALLMDPPPELAAAVITVGPHDFAESTWGTGSFTLNDFLGWSDMVSHQEDPGLAPGGRPAGRGRAAASHGRAQDLPLGAAGRTLLGAGAPWWESWLRATRRDDPVLGAAAPDRRTRPRRGPGAAVQRLAGPVPRPDAGRSTGTCAAAASRPR